MLEMLKDEYNMATMKPNKVCVDLFSCLLATHTLPLFVPTCVYMHVSHLQEMLKVKPSLMWAVSSLPSARAGTRPCT